jgi:hypothetical protein
MEAQWTGVNALGLPLAYRDWRAGKAGRGALSLVLFAGVAKPHLALGLIAFALGWRERRFAQGAVAGAIGGAVLSIAAVGIGGVGGFLNLVAQSSTQFAPSSFVGIYGFAGAVLDPALQPRSSGSRARSPLVCWRCSPVLRSGGIAPASRWGSPLPR